MDKLLTIAIPTWDNRGQLETCLQTLTSYTKFPYQVMVIDNANESFIKESSAEWPSFVEYHAPGENLGWMGGINYALERCKTPYFCMMNDDVMFIPNSLNFWKSLIDPFTHDDRVGMVGPKSNFIAGLQNIRYVNPHSFDTTFAIGVCLALKTEFFREIGGLDESLPGGDDLDLTIRVRKADKRVRIASSAFLYHIGKQSGIRAQGKHYDSAWHQEVVKNAIIRKHGLKWQYETWSMDIVGELIPEEGLV
jgi:GT2 family glycosyltransferase